MRSSASHVSTLIFVLSFFGLSACMSKGIEMTDQQQRMARCDQYVDMARDKCLRGENVTFNDYREEYKDFEKDVREKTQAENQKVQKALGAEEKMKAEKLKAALENAKLRGEQAKQEQIEKQIQALEDGTK
jgi:hypothetical protein